MKKETVIQNRIRVALSEFGIVLRINNGKFLSLDGKRVIDLGLPNGIPDLLVLLPGMRCVWFETKTPVGRLSADQRNFHQILRNLGHTVFVPRSVEDAVTQIKEVL